MLLLIVSSDGDSAVYNVVNYRYWPIIVDKDNLNNVLLLQHYFYVAITLYHGVNITLRNSALSGIWFGRTNKYSVQRVQCHLHQLLVSAVLNALNSSLARCTECSVNCINCKLVQCILTAVDC